MSQLHTPSIHVRNSITRQPTVGELVSAILIKNGTSDPSQCRVEKVRNTFHRMAPCHQFERDADLGKDLSVASMLDLVRHAARLDGARVPNGETPGVMQTIWHHYRSAVSTAAMSELFNSPFGSIFLEGYDSEIDSTVGWTSESDSLNLKKSQRIRPTRGNVFKKRARGETAEEFSFGVVSEDTQMGEYTAGFVIDEPDIINNQFGNFDEITPRQMGRAAKRLRPDLIFAALLANSNMRDGNPLFHAIHANLQSTAALAEVTLSDGQTLVGQQTEGGVQLNLDGRYLIVPKSLSRAAAKLSKDIFTDGDATESLFVRGESRLDNGVIDPADGTAYPGDETTWYLSTSGANAIDVEFLEGTGRQPEIRFGFLKEGQFGMWFDVQHFIGAKALDWRGMVKSTA